MRYIIASAPLRTDWGARRPLSSPNTLRTRFAVSEPFPRREVASTAPEHVEVHHRGRAPSDGLGATKATVIPEHPSHAVRRLRAVPAAGGGFDRAGGCRATSSRPRPFGRTGGHEGRCHPRTPFARGSPSPSRSRGGRWLRPRRSTLRYIIAVAPLRTDSGPRRPRSSPNTLRTRFAVSDRSRGERALRPRRRLPSDIIASAPLRTDWGARRPRSSPNTLRTRFAVSEPFPRREVASTAPEHVEVHHRGRAPSDGLGATKATVIPEHASHAVRRLRPFPRRKGTSSAPEAARATSSRPFAPSDGLGGTKAACHPRTRFARGSPSPSRSRGGRLASTAPEHVEVHHRGRAPSDGLGATKATVIPEHASHAVRRLRPFPRRKGTSSAPEAAERHHRVRAPSDGLGGTKAAVIPEHASHAVRRLRAVPAAGGGFDRAGAR